jgi:hypothetical protein
MTFAGESMTHSNVPGAWRCPHRLMLGLVLAVVLAIGWAAAAEPVAAAPDPAPAAASDEDATPPTDAAAVTEAPAKAGSSPSDVTITSRGVIVGKDGHRVSVRGLGGDHEYDSFEDFINDAPWLAGIVFLALLMTFLTPLLIVVLFIWYKIRKTRMQNETMLKLAEKGVVPPAEAMSSIAAPNPGSQTVPPSAAPLYEQARQLRKRAAWSDLRKGVMFIAVGLGFIFYSMLGDGEPNWLGLTCLFVGIGFCILWYFEERQTPPARRDAGTPPSSA